MGGEFPMRVQPIGWRLAYGWRETRPIYQGAIIIQSSDPLNPHSEISCYTTTAGIGAPLYWEGVCPDCDDSQHTEMSCTSSPFCRWHNGDCEDIPKCASSIPVAIPFKTLSL